MSKRKLLLANNPLLSGPGLEERERYTSPYREIPISAVEADKNQPRAIFDDEKLEELAKSIQSYGVLSPILVRSGPLPGRYTVVAGERRLRAARKAGLNTIPAIVDQEGAADAILAKQLVENLQRADLTPLERATAIGALKENFQMSIREIADNLGVSKGMIQRSLEILQLPTDLIEALKQGAAESKILMLAQVKDPEARSRLLLKLESLTRSDLQTTIRGSTGSPSNARVTKEVLQPEDIRIADEIQRALGLRVKLTRSGPEGGRLSIEFYSDDDLQEIFRKLVSEQ